MQERLQKIIARAGIASRRHAEQLILSGQVRVNGRVVTELGTKADAATDRIEAAGRVVRQEEEKVYLVLNKPPEVVSTLADPEGRRTLRDCLRGFRERVYPVGRLDYAASGLVFLTNDGDLANEMLRAWDRLPQTYFLKVKGRLPDELLKEAAAQTGATLRPLRLPDASRRRGANFWYEATISSATAKRSTKDSGRDAVRRFLFAKEHPVEKIKRVGLGSLTLEGLPQGRYRRLSAEEVEQLRRMIKFKCDREAVDRKDNAETSRPGRGRRRAERHAEKRRPGGDERRERLNAEKTK